MQNNFDAETEKETEATNKEKSDKAKAWRDKQKAEEEADAKLKLERERLYQDLMIDNIEDEYLRKATAFNIAQEREKQALIEKYGQDKALIEQLEAQQANDRIAFNKEMQDNINADIEKDVYTLALERINRTYDIFDNIDKIKKNIELTEEPILISKLTQITFSTPVCDNITFDIDEKLISINLSIDNTTEINEEEYRIRFTENIRQFQQYIKTKIMNSVMTVSYTHLTLPTNREV